MKENNSQKTRPAIRMEEKDAFACNNLQMLPDSPDPLFAGKGISSGCRGINTRKLGNTKAGGDQVEQSATVVVNNVIYDVTRVFSGKRKAERKCGVEHVQLYDRRLSAWRDPSCKEKKRGGKAWKALT